MTGNPGMGRGPKRLFFFMVSVVGLVLMISCPSPSIAEDLTLSLSSTQGSPNQTVSLTLNLDYTANPLASGFNLDIYFDREALEITEDTPIATAGQILIDAGKDMVVGHPPHPYFGVFRIIVSGGQDIIGAGEAATIYFDIRLDAPEGQTDLTLTSLAATDPDGQPLAPMGSAGSIAVYTDSDGDGFYDPEDNCPDTPNTGQEDTSPPQGNGIGDACDCEADFNCDGNVDAADVASFLADFGRSTFFNPCINADPCNGDFDCNVNVDADDVNKFLEDFGRSPFFNPCPQCEGGGWCNY